MSSSTEKRKTLEAHLLSLEEMSYKHTCKLIHS